MEIMFKEKKTFFSIRVFFLFKTHLFPCSFYAQVFLYYFAVFLEQFYMFFSCDKNPVLFKSNLRLWFQKSKKKQTKKDTFRTFFVVFFVWVSLENAIPVFQLLLSLTLFIKSSVIRAHKRKKKLVALMVGKCKVTVERVNEIMRPSKLQEKWKKATQLSAFHFFNDSVLCPYFTSCRHCNNYIVVILFIYK